MGGVGGVVGGVGGVVGGAAAASVVAKRKVNQVDIRDWSLASNRGSSLHHCPRPKGPDTKCTNAPARGVWGKGLPVLCERAREGRCVGGWRFGCHM